jgi:hypothetical protein
MHSLVGVAQESILDVSRRVWRGERDLDTVTPCKNHSSPSHAQQYYNLSSSLSGYCLWTRYYQSLITRPPIALEPRWKRPDVALRTPRSPRLSQPSDESLPLSSGRVIDENCRAMDQCSSAFSRIDRSILDHHLIRNVPEFYDSSFSLRHIHFSPVYVCFWQRFQSWCSPMLDGWTQNLSLWHASLYLSRAQSSQNPWIFMAMALPKSMCCFAATECWSTSILTYHG